MRYLHLIVVFFCFIGFSANGQDFSWAENAGWLNWDSANGDSNGPQFEVDSISGSVWGENIGWINLGDGAPVPEASMQTGEDFGVGVDDDGFLFGYGWGENIGWVSFGPFANKSAQPRFRRGILIGFLWAENIGWVNLGNEEHFVQLTCPADLNADGFTNFFDISMFLQYYLDGSLRVDWDDNGALNFFDISEFIVAVSQQC